MNIGQWMDKRSKEIQEEMREKGISVCLLLHHHPTKSFSMSQTMGEPLAIGNMEVYKKILTDSIVEKSYTEPVDEVRN